MPYDAKQQTIICRIMCLTIRYHKLKCKVTLFIIETCIILYGWRTLFDQPSQFCGLLVIQGLAMGKVQDSQSARLRTAFSRLVQLVPLLIACYEKYCIYLDIDLGVLLSKIFSTFLRPQKSMHSRTAMAQTLMAHLPRLF